MVSHFVRNDVTDICRIAVLFPQFLQKTVRAASARCYGRVVFCALVDFYAGAHPTLTVRELFREPFFLISFALGCAIVIMMGYDIVHHQIKRKNLLPKVRLSRSP